MAETAVVIGAGMAGLCAALTLAPTGRRVILVEKDPPPPEGGADTAFFDWRRTGVGHLRHSHAFLARLRTILKDGHPDLLEALKTAGCREIGFSDMIPERLKSDYVPAPGDGDLAVLTSRRTTLEWVMRRYVEALDGVTIETGVFVDGLLTDAPDPGQVRVRGVTGRRGETRVTLEGEVVIDAGGRTSSAIEHLEAAGARVATESHPCGIVYYTRHYRLLPGLGEPERSSAPGTGDLGFIKYGLFPGDNRCFSVTLAVPEIETELRTAVVRPEIFDRICAQFPGIRPWTDPERSEPVSQVFGMGDLVARWRTIAAPDQRAPVGFFALGDSLVRTNPLYGRGCSFAAIEASLLAETLEATADPAARARLYETKVRNALYPFFEDMCRQDRSAERRAAAVRAGETSSGLRSRILSSFIDDGVRIAVRDDVGLLRAALRDFHMIEPPGQWIRRPGNLTKVVSVWARGRRRNAALYPPSPGPDRATLMADIGIGAAPAAAE